MCKARDSLTAEAEEAVCVLPHAPQMDPVHQCICVILVLQTSRLRWTFCSARTVQKHMCILYHSTARLSAGHSRSAGSSSLCKKQCVSTAHKGRRSQPDWHQHYAQAGCQAHASEATHQAVRTAACMCLLMRCSAVQGTSSPAECPTQSLCGSQDPARSRSHQRKGALLQRRAGS